MGLNGEGGMSTVKKLDTDYSEYLGFLRFVLSVTERGGSNGLADWINTKPKAGVRNASWWGKSGEHCVHAVATRKGSGSDIPLDEVDFMKARYVQVINDLPAPFPDQIRGRCSSSPSVWQIFSIINPVLDSYRETVPKARAAAMLNFELRGWDESRQGPKPHVRELFGHSKDTWPDAKERKAWDEVNRKLRELLKPAIAAWVAECEKRGLEM
tara:strand:- start:12490 stop:13125 length:636 start_codon:yes stop_codon:yes gene_type:complete